MGFTAQLIAWDDELLRARSPTAAATSSASTTATAGCRPSSTAQRVDPMAVHAGQPRRRAELPPVPYTLSDMAADARRPARPPRHRAGPRRRRVDGRDDRADDRDRAPRPRAVSLTSIMSSPGDPRVGKPTPGGAGGAADAAADRARGVHRRRRPRRGRGVEAVLRRRRGAASAPAAAFDRAFYPEGAPRQLAAIYASGDRTERSRERRRCRRSSSTAATTR